ncbi:MAG: hypothetical protein ACYDBB_17725 [Armatimonadota bacterium]
MSSKRLSPRQLVGLLLAWGLCVIALSLPVRQPACGLSTPPKSWISRMAASRLPGPRESSMLLAEDFTSPSMSASCRQVSYWPWARGPPAEAVLHAPAYFQYAKIVGILLIPIERLHW